MAINPQGRIPAPKLERSLQEGFSPRGELSLEEGSSPQEGISSQEERAARDGLSTAPADVERAFQGDALGFNRLVADHWVAVASYATRFLEAGRDAGDDVAQEVFLLVWGGQVEWDCRSSVRGFLLGVARKLCQNRRRRRSVRARLSGQVRAQLRALQRTASPSEVLEEAELRRRLEAVLDTMPERRRESFLLIRMQGLSYADAARVMRVSPQTVANQMSAALKDLRRAL